MSNNAANPLRKFIDQQGTVILDGGLATTLEERGHDLNDKLWSAKVLLEDPEAIAAVHRDFLTAGADCLITATYQATTPGLREQGLGPDQAHALFTSAVNLALAARDDFWSRKENRPGRLRPVVAASVGPYGAFLADGSEYSGLYRIGPNKLAAFHRERWEVLSSTGADLLACETLPSLAETRVLLDLLAETPGHWAWFSFSCRDGSSLCDGAPFAEAVSLCGQADQVAAIGINCTDPAFVAPLLEVGRDHTDKPLIVYPNSGETYDPGRKTWSLAEGRTSLKDLAPRWRELGAQGIGGCCRIGPAAIREIRGVLLD